MINPNIAELTELITVLRYEQVSPDCCIIAEIRTPAGRYAAPWTVREFRIYPGLDDNGSHYRTLEGDEYYYHGAWTETAAETARNLLAEVHPDQEIYISDFFGLAYHTPDPEMMKEKRR